MKYDQTFQPTPLTPISVELSLEPTGLKKEEQSGVSSS